MIWDEQSATCSRVASGLEIDFLTASAGSVKDPQATIRYARARPVYTQWTHPFAGRFAGNSSDAEFAFPVTLRVRFVPQAQSVKDVVRQLPPLRTSLPEDFFYPFTSTAGFSLRGSAWRCFMLAVAVATAVIFE
jgi:hypothetical protein